jgi:hypothetical protein
MSLVAVSVVTVVVVVDVVVDLDLHQTGQKSKILRGELDVALSV